MIFIKVSKSGLPVEVATGLTTEQHQDKAWQSRWDWQDYETVDRLAKYVTAMTGETYLPVDNARGHSPRYDIVAAPKVGDPVSYGFNGDYYPCGHITRITKGWRVYTSEGKTFNRFKNTGGWQMVGGTWGMVAGHIDERNPHF